MFGKVWVGLLAEPFWPISIPLQYYVLLSRHQRECERNGIFHNDGSADISTGFFFLFNWALHFLLQFSSVKRLNRACLFAYNSSMVSIMEESGISVQNQCPQTGMENYFKLLKVILWMQAYVLIKCANNVKANIVLFSTKN